MKLTLRSRQVLSQANSKTRYDKNTTHWALTKRDDAICGALIIELGYFKIKHEKVCVRQAWPWTPQQQHYERRGTFTNNQRPTSVSKTARVTFKILKCSCYLNSDTPSKENMHYWQQSEKAWSAFILYIRKTRISPPNIFLSYIKARKVPYYLIPLDNNASFCNEVGEESNILQGTIPCGQSLQLEDNCNNSRYRNVSSRSKLVSRKPCIPAWRCLAVGKLLKKKGCKPPKDKQFNHTLLKQSGRLPAKTLPHLHIIVASMPLLITPSSKT